ncbi:MAG: hypothetical protein ACI9BW_004085 [Gammaproteobacteria bacterium]|jgi:hypothetical protein
MKVDGKCHCGDIEFEAEIDPARVVICHCTDCQVLSGTAFRTVVFADGDTLTFKKGEPKIYVKTAQSGNPRAQGFCGNCGSAIYATSVGDGPKVYGLRAGSLSQRESLVPGKQVWSQSALSWVGDIESLPAVQQQA